MVKLTKFIHSVGHHGAMNSLKMITDNNTEFINSPNNKENISESEVLEKIELYIYELKQARKLASVNTYTITEKGTTFYTVTIYTIIVDPYIPDA